MVFAFVYIFVQYIDSMSESFIKKEKKGSCECSELCDLEPCSRRVWVILLDHTSLSACWHMTALKSGTRNACLVRAGQCCCDCFDITIKEVYFVFFFFSLLCFRGVFQSLVSKHFPSEKQRREKAPGNKRKRKLIKSQAFLESMHIARLMSCHILSLYR